MKGLRLGWTLLACLSLGLTACGGDDDDDDGGGACAHAQMLCPSMGDTTIDIDCAEFGSAPASIKDCVAKATTCDGVTACLLGGAAGGGG